MNRRAPSAALAPSLGIFAAGLMWGLFWLPMRSFADKGLTAAWPSVLVFATCSMLLLPIILWRWRRLSAHWRPLLWSAIFTGSSIAWYATSLLLTDVARTILLFYLTPLWSTLVGLIWLGEKLTGFRALALILGLFGLLIVLGLGAQVPWPANIGDWMALVAGFLWAFGMLGLFNAGTVAITEQIFSISVGALIVTLLSILVFDIGVGPTLSLQFVLALWPNALFAGAYLIPMFFLTIWPGTILTPGRIGILLMGEVVVGTSSAALWAGEPFGLRELTGAALIVSAGLVEVLGRAPRQETAQGLNP